VPQCPQCTKRLVELSRECPYCRSNLDLLVDYVNQLQDGLAQAERFTREGELGQAVWAYLSVLEVDPDNAPARRQVGQVATAVRQFDRTAPGRRWLSRLRGEANDESAARLTRWLRIAVAAGLLVAAFFLGFVLGRQDWDTEPSSPEPPQQQRDDLLGR
jgi:hypothetical protein